MIEASYFIKGVFPLMDFLRQNGLNDGEAIIYSEIIPYYCIKYFEQGKTKNQTYKNPLNRNLYENYIKTFASMNKKLSEKGADIICLYAKASFDCLKSKNDKTGLKMIQDGIKKYQVEFINEIGEDGIYGRQKNYLSSSLVILNNAINKTLQFRTRKNTVLSFRSSVRPDTELVRGVLSTGSSLFFEQLDENGKLSFFHRKSGRHFYERDSWNPSLAAFYELCRKLRTGH